MTAEMTETLLPLVVENDQSRPLSFPHPELGASAVEGGFGAIDTRSFHQNNLLKGRLA